MSESQLKARRATRAKAVLERGEKLFEVEQAEVRSCNGGVAKACGSFLYLGSLTDKKGSSGPEIRRRIKKATETFRRLWRVWAMKGLPLKLKGRLYSAFVHFVLLYNSEVWTITETEIKAIVGRNGCLMRRLVGEAVRSADDKRLTEVQLLEMLDEDEGKMKERISVKVDGVGMWRWIVPAKWRAELGIMVMSKRKGRWLFN